MSRFLTLLGPALLALIAGCGDHDHAHDAGGGGGHSHDPLFGGTLVELGDHFANLEVLHDPHAGTLDLYLLDGHAAKAVKGPQVEMALRIEIEGVVHDLVAAPQVSELAGNEVGSSSHFRVQSDILLGLTEFELTVSRVEVLGDVFQDVPYSHGQ